MPQVSGTFDLALDMSPDVLAAPFVTDPNFEPTRWHDHTNEGYVRFVRHVNGYLLVINFFVAFNVNGTGKLAWEGSDCGVGHRVAIAAYKEQAFFGGKPQGLSVSSQQGTRAGFNYTFTLLSLSPPYSYRPWFSDSTDLLGYRHVWDTALLPAGADPTSEDTFLKTYYTMDFSNTRQDVTGNLQYSADNGIITLAYPATRYFPLITSSYVWTPNAASPPAFAPFVKNLRASGSSLTPSYDWPVQSDQTDKALIEVLDGDIGNRMTYSASVRCVL